MNPPLSIGLPITYWLTTRLPSAGAKCQYVFAVVGPQIVWLAWVTGGLYVLGVFAALFVAMICVYEAGYLINDYWSQRREMQAGLAVRKTPPAPVPTIYWLSGGLSRALVVLGALWIVAQQGLQVWGAVIYLAVLFAVFVAHNTVLGSRRVVTFFLLYVVRLLLPLVTVLLLALPVGIGSLTGWVVFAVILSGGFAVSYGMKKNFVPARVSVAQIGGVEFPILVSVVFSIPLLLAAGVAGLVFAAAYDFAIGLLFPVAYLFAYWIVWSSLRYLAEVRNGLHRAKTVLSHCHTNFSHDGTIEVADYEAWLDQDAQRTVYLTDHAEDFDAKTYARLRAAYRHLSPRVVPGLEYPVAKQHILVQGLGEYVDVEGLKPEQALTKLSERSERLIWAHPRFSMRKLLSIQYWAEALTLLAGVDAVEFYNPKNISRRRYIIMMHATAWLSGALYGRRQLYLGVDAHHPKELPG
ncbi:MAG: hypothetical protein ABJ176_06955 [Anderseniella sp.]